MPFLCFPDIARPVPAARLALAAGFAILLAGSGGAQTFPVPAEGITLQPHRIAYEVTLDPRRSGNSFSAARGLMVLEFTGNACAGYVTNFRQVTELGDADGNARNLDFKVNLWEDGEGKRFRFTLHHQMNGKVTRDAEGEARKADDGSLTIAMKRPRGRGGDFDGNVVFPSAMTRDLIGAAMRGDRTHAVRLFDGSEGGEKVYDASAAIGLALNAERNARIEAPVAAGIDANIPRWPVSVSYFEDGPGDRVPVYTMRSVTFANGVMSDIVFQFPEFSLAARAVRYEALKPDACSR